MTRRVSFASADVVVPISGTADVLIAQGRARELAADLGFDKRGQWEIATAVSEAATNIVKYGRDGRIILRRLSKDGSGLEFEAIDEGRGIDEIERAMTDGVSEGVDVGETMLEPLAPRPRGLGQGLGAIKRLMDRLQVENLPRGRGVSVRARKLIRHRDP